jgi:hypothetical protein
MFTKSGAKQAIPTMFSFLAGDLSPFSGDVTVDLIGPSMTMELYDASTMVLLVTSNSGHLQHWQNASASLLLRVAAGHAAGLRPKLSPGYRPLAI